MNKLKILAVDDESRMRKLVKDFLVKQNYEVLEAGDGSEALDIFFENQDIALIILDIMMPKMDGWQVCREIRNYSKVPIIMLTARTDERDELQGFQLGVDEYISKPFSPKILVARVEAILRRTAQVSENTLLECGGISIDKAAHVVSIDGNPIELSFKEFELLTYFVENKGIALSREKILNSVWNYDYFGDARTIDTHVKKLRSKMGDKGDLIKTVWGMGYKLEVLIYVLVNYAFLTALPFKEIIGNQNTAYLASLKLFGSLGGKLVTIGILISVYGAINGFMLTGMRIPYTLAQNKMLPFSDKISRTNVNTGVPTLSALIILFVSLIMILLGTFDLLTNMLVFVMWTFTTLISIAVVILRYREPKLERPYVVPWYPIVPIISIGGGLFIVISTVINEFWLSITGIGLTLLGLPIYYYMKKQNNRQ